MGCKGTEPEVPKEVPLRQETLRKYYAARPQREPLTEGRPWFVSREKKNEQIFGTSVRDTASVVGLLQPTPTLSGVIVYTPEGNIH